MQSNIANELNPKFKPIVLIKCDEKPSDAIGPETPIGGCSMAYVARTIVDRVPTFFGREYGTCMGISSGLGWSEPLTDAAIDFQACFLSKGIDSAEDNEYYINLLNGKSDRVKTMFMEGERFYEDYETAYENIKERPIYNNGNYVLFKPLEDLAEDEIPQSVIFTVDAFELAILLLLDGSHRKEESYVITPQASGCQSIGCHVFRQADADNPHPVLGLLDLASRKYLKGIPKEYVTLSFTWDLFLKLEKLSEDSVFKSCLFKSIVTNNP